MKKQFKWILPCASVCLATAASFGQAGYGVLPVSSGTNQITTTREVKESRQFFHSKDLVGANVKDSQGQKLGDIHDIVFNPHSGEMFAAISVGHGDYALVPSQALTITLGTGMIRHKAEVTLNTTKEALQSGPTIKNDEWNQLDAPSFTQSVYGQYKLQAPSAVGGVSSSSLGGVCSGAGASTNLLNKPATAPR